MKLHLKAIEVEFDGPTIIGDEVLTISTEGVKEPYTRDFILETLFKAQQEGKFQYDWFEKEGIQTKSEEPLDLSALKLSLDAETSSSMLFADYSYVNLIPETTEEFEAYFNKFLSEKYPTAKEKNAVFVIPPWRCFVDYYSSKQVGASLILPAFKKFTDERDRFGDRKTIDYWYRILLTDLSRPVLNISAPKWLVPHLIGSKGKKIQEIKEMLHSAGFTNVKRINLIEVQQEEEEYASL